MMKTLFFLLLFPFLVFSQNENTEYKKVFYDNLLRLTDSSLSVYYGYDLFYNNELLYYISKRNTLNKRGHFELVNKSQLDVGNPVLLNDTIIIHKYRRNGSLRYIDKRFFKNGYMQYSECKHFASNNKLAFIEIMDLSKKYKNQIGSYFGYEIHNNGTIRYEYWFHFDGQKWKTSLIRN